MSKAIDILDKLMTQIFADITKVESKGMSTAVAESLREDFYKIEEKIMYLMEDITA